MPVLKGLGFCTILEGQFSFWRGEAGSPPAYRLASPKLFLQHEDVRYVHPQLQLHVMATHARRHRDVKGTCFGQAHLVCTACSMKQSVTQVTGALSAG